VAAVSSEAVAPWQTAAAAKLAPPSKPEGIWEAEEERNCKAAPLSASEVAAEVAGLVGSAAGCVGDAAMVAVCCDGSTRGSGASFGQGGGGG
jgi:hypothetical protein